jgi:hypothetical protein
VAALRANLRLVRFGHGNLGGLLLFGSTFVGCGNLGQISWLLGLPFVVLGAGDPHPCTITACKARQIGSKVNGIHRVFFADRALHGVFFPFW